MRSAQQARSPSLLPVVLLSVLVLLHAAAGQAAGVDADTPWFDTDDVPGGSSKHARPAGVAVGGLSATTHKAGGGGATPTVAAEPGVIMTSDGAGVDWKSAADPIDFVAYDDKLYANGEPFSLKGANWWGSESRNGPPGGL